MSEQDCDWPLGKPGQESSDSKTLDSKPSESGQDTLPDMSEEAIGERLNGEHVIPLRHADMEKVSENSYWKVECPFCEDGLFIVTRDQKTLRLLEYDKCLGCGQVVRWTDIKEMRKRDGIGQ